MYFSFKNVIIILAFIFELYNSGKGVRDDDLFEFNFAFMALLFVLKGHLKPDHMDTVDLRDLQEALKTNSVFHFDAKMITFEKYFCMSILILFRFCEWSENPVYLIDSMTQCDRN